MKNLIINRINNFFGFGNLNGKIWFIGMEEGFDINQFNWQNKLFKRFLLSYGYSIIDIKGINVSDHMQWFLGNPPRYQNTYGRLIRVLLSYHYPNNEFKLNDIKYFQKDYFSRAWGNHCCLELGPLPSPNTNIWIYNRYGLAYTITRNAYENIVLPKRRAMFQNMIEVKKPHIVIFYSHGYRESQWEPIIGKKTNKINNNLYYVRNNRIYYFIIPHPNARRMTNQIWHRIGHTINNFCNNIHQKNYFRFPLYNEI